MKAEEILTLRNKSRELQAKKRELEEEIQANDRKLSGLTNNTILIT